MDALSYETFTDGLAPVGTGTAELPPKPCHWCLVGDHAKCTGLECWRCPAVNHPRHPGVSGLGEGTEHGATRETDRG